MEGVYSLALCLIIIVLNERNSSGYPIDTSQSFIYSFSYEIKNSSDDQWKSSNGIVKGTETRLNCITDSPSTTIIRRFNQSDSLLPLTYTEHHTFYDFGQISCDYMGTYVCEDGHGATRHLDLGILKCEPRLCDGETRNEVLPVELHKPISLCIQAYPAVSGVEIVQRASDGQKASSSKGFTWRIEKTTTTFGMYTLNITLTDVLPQASGANRLFDVVVLHTTKPRKQTLGLTLEVENDEQTTLISQPTLETSFDKQETADSANTTVIVAGTVMVLGAVLIVALAIFLFRRKGKNSKRGDDFMEKARLKHDETAKASGDSVYFHSA